jgi:ATP-dependent Clp protease ATP-binding subunit ClpC
MVFHALNRDHIKAIVDLEIGKVSTRLAEHELSLRLTDEARDYLAEKGYDPNLGARPLRRVIQMEVEDALSEGVLSGSFNAGDLVVVDVEDGEVAFRTDNDGDSDPVTEVENGEAPPMLETMLS